LHFSTLEDEGFHSVKISGDSNPLTPFHVPKRPEPSTAPLRKPEILKTTPQNHEQIRSLDTAGNTFLAACTKNVCLHP